MKIGYFDDLEHFLAMDGHGAYVWVCILVTLLALGSLAVLPGMKQRALAKNLTQQSKQQSASNNL